MTATDKVDDLSEYEKLRAKNIERNNKRLCILGLLTENEANALNATAWRRRETFKSRSEKDTTKNYEPGKNHTDDAIATKNRRTSSRQKARIRTFRAVKSVWI